MIAISGTRNLKRKNMAFDGARCTLRDQSSIGKRFVYLPLQTGSRFSANALKPSSMSSEP